MIQNLLMVPGFDADAASAALVLLGSVTLAWLVYAITNPLEPIAVTIAYRRLRVPNPEILPVAPPSPRRDQAARAIVAGLAAVYLLGVVVNAGRQAELRANGFAERGSITFGSGPPTNAFACMPEAAARVLRAGERLVWAAFLKEPLGPAADVEIEIWYNGVSMGRVTQGSSEAGTVCLWGEEPAGALGTGMWRIDVFVDDGLAASGEVTILP